MKTVSLVASVLLASPAFAADDLSYARICDPSGCYLAMGVVDSDHDGVCDADEVMAGTDPYDPNSRPLLRVVVTLAQKDALPSFMARVGQFTVFPPEFQAEFGGDDPLVGFPLGERGDTLTRLGISAELMSAHGIDPDRDGMNFQLDAGGDRDAPPRRVGGVDIRLISADGDDLLAPLDPKCGEHGDVVRQELVPDGYVFHFADGATMTNLNDGGGYVKDKDGNTVGTWYVNPDADPSGTDAPTAEQFAHWERMQGTAMQTVLDWSAPGSESEPPERLDLLVLIDPEYLEDPGMLSAGPQLDGAQPEVNPNLPSPLLPGSLEGSKCVVGCPDQG